MGVAGVVSGSVSPCWRQALSPTRCSAELYPRQRFFWVSCWQRHRFHRCGVPGSALCDGRGVAAAVVVGAHLLRGVLGGVAG